MEATHFEYLYPPETRLAEIEKILKFVREGKSVQLVGLAGTGRSNVLGLLSYNKNIRGKHLGGNQKWFHFVPINFTEIRGKLLSDATKFIFLCLVDSLRERKMNEEFEFVDKILKENVSVNDEMILFQGLKRAFDYLSIEKELTVVLLFDRFEEYIPMLTPEFFANLRIIRNKAKYRFSAVFSLSRPLEELLEPTLFADFYEFLAGNIVYLPILDKPGLTFRISYLEKVSGKQIDKKLIDKITYLTGGHGKLTRLSLEGVSSNKDKIENLKSYLLNIKPIQGALFEIWQSLLPSEQKLLVKTGDNSDFLGKIELTKNGNISIPLFEEFVKLNSSQLLKTKISFDKNTGDIKIGDTSLSSSLTSSEFRLLKYLLENPEKIIKREEIINAVWQDNKSKEGVTEQALDQLIFRLRKKIEEDPNNPVHLQTLKGLGVKFTA